jgi:hypothetical protein
MMTMTTLADVRELVERQAMPAAVVTPPIRKRSRPTRSQPQEAKNWFFFHVGLSSTK